MSRETRSSVSLENAGANAKVENDGKGKDVETNLRNIQVDAEIVQAQQPLSEEDRDEEKANVVADEATENKLPFSKARCIGLVLTVTCAAILNVSLLLSFHRKLFH